MKSSPEMAIGPQEYPVNSRSATKSRKHIQICQGDFGVFLSHFAVLSTEWIEPKLPVLSYWLLYILRPYGTGVMDVFKHSKTATRSTVLLEFAASDLQIFPVGTF
jgi:hypothetical protein